MKKLVNQVFKLNTLLGTIRVEFFHVNYAYKRTKEVSL